MAAQSASHTPHFTPGGPTLSLELLAHIPPAITADPSAVLVFHGARFGENAIAVARAFAGRVIGTDQDAEAVSYARMQLGTPGTPANVTFRVLSPLATAMPAESCNVVFLEGIISELSASRTLAEAVRILRPGGMVCISDSIWVKTPVPTAIAELWETANRKVHTLDDLGTLAASRGLEQVAQRDASTVLEAFYSQFIEDVRHKVKTHFEGEKHLKGLIRHYKHEIDMYLKFGGRDHMGYGISVYRKPD